MDQSQVEHGRRRQQLPLRARSWAPNAWRPHGSPRAWSCACPTATQRPESSAALLVGGQVLLREAWAARGSGTADTVTEEGGQDYASLSSLADRFAAVAAQVDPADPLPWVLRLRTALYAVDELAWLRACFAEADRRSPDLVPAWMGWLTVASEKWLGDHDTMFEIARSARTRPPGHPLHVLVILAHVERWLYHLQFEQDRAAATAYLADATVRGEVEAAWADFEAAVPGTGDGHFARSVAACWFYMVQDKPKLARAFGTLPVYFDPGWQYVGGVNAQLRARALVGA